MKKIVSILLSLFLIMLIFLSFAFVSLAEEQTTDIEKTQLGTTDTYYSFDAETKTLVISGNGATPDFVNTSSSQPWYLWRNNGSIERVVVEEGITYIGNYIFYYIGAGDISLPSTLKSIGNYSLSGNSALVDIVLPDGLETISSSAFRLCRNLQGITIPSTVKMIGQSAFEYCSGMTELVFEDMNAKITIDNKAFHECSALEQVSVPKRATVNRYAFGYYNDARMGETTYDNFLMNVYRESPAYVYAVNNYIDYNLISSMEISEGSVIECTYFKSTYNSDMNFYFTPSVTAEYNFYSTGNVDVDCCLYDSDDNQVAQSTDISPDNLNFYISCTLSANKTYCFTISSVMSAGDFTVTLYPKNIDAISAQWNTSISSTDAVNGRYDVLGEITGSQLEIIYDTGFTDVVSFENGKTYFDSVMTYSDNQSVEPWHCGNNTATITLGDYSCELLVEIAHSFVKNVVLPDVSDSGYTRYTCSSCRYSYITDYVEFTGRCITGRLVLLEAPDGSHPHNITMPLMDIEAQGKKEFITDITGEFEVYVPYDTEKLEFASVYTYRRTIDISEYDGKYINLGDVAICGYNYIWDNYINAKDYAAFKTIYGEYPQEEMELYIPLDYNKDGCIDDEDWQYAENFIGYGKIDESIYDNN